jgi:hypothetical protein
MLYYDRKSYEQHRDTILKLIKPIKYGLIGLIAISAIACYNAAMMRVSGESRDTCQNDSDCAEEYMCVRNVSADSTLGECVHQDDYDPWANRRLDDIIKLKDKKKVKEKVPKEQSKATINDPDLQVTHEEIRKALINLIENALVEAAHLQAIDAAAAKDVNRQLNNVREQCECIQQNK